MCMNPAPTSEGTGCAGETHQTEPCYKDPCEGSAFEFLVLTVLFSGTILRWFFEISRTKTNLPFSDNIRTRLPGEITSLQAAQSETWEDDDEKYGAKLALDLNLHTCAAPSGDEASHKVYLGQEKCIKQIITFLMDGSPHLQFNCAPAGCVCEGHASCDLYALNVYSDTTDTPQSTDCKRGRGFKLRRHTGTGFRVCEIAVTETKGGRFTLLYKSRNLFQSH